MLCATCVTHQSPMPYLNLGPGGGIIFTDRKYRNAGEIPIQIDGKNMIINNDHRFTLNMPFDRGNKNPFSLANTLGKISQHKRNKIRKALVEVYPDWDILPHMFDLPVKGHEESLLMLVKSACMLEKDNMTFKSSARMLFHDVTKTKQQEKHTALFLLLPGQVVVVKNLTDREWKGNSKAWAQRFRWEHGGIVPGYNTNIQPHHKTAKFYYEKSDIVHLPKDATDTKRAYANLHTSIEQELSPN